MASVATKLKELQREVGDVSVDRLYAEAKKKKIPGTFRLRASAYNFSIPTLPTSLWISLSLAVIVDMFIINAKILG